MQGDVQNEIKIFKHDNFNATRDLNIKSWTDYGTAFTNEGSGIRTQIALTTRSRFH